MDELVFFSVCPPHDSRFPCAMNALGDLKKYESLRLKVAICPELFEDFTVLFLLFEGRRRRNSLSPTSL